MINLYFIKSMNNIQSPKRILKVFFNNNTMECPITHPAQISWGIVRKIDEALSIRTIWKRNQYYELII